MPLIAGPLLLARWITPEGPLRCGLSAACGGAIFLHLHGLLLNLRLNSWGDEADIPRVGHVLAYALVVSALLLLSAAAVVALWSSHPPAWWSVLVTPPAR